MNSTPPGSRRAHSIYELCFQNLVADALRRHRHKLPADQLDPLVLVHEAGHHHGLDLGHCETARQAFGGLRRLAFTGPVSFE